MGVTAICTSSSVLRVLDDSESSMAYCIGDKGQEAASVACAHESHGKKAWVSPHSGFASL